MSSESFAHVVDIGGSHVTSALVALSPGGATAASETYPRIVRRAERDIDPHGAAGDILDGWAAACSEVGASAATWAFAMPAPFDFERGVGTFENVGKFEHLAGVDLRGQLAARLGVAGERIRFLHDAGAYGIGEWMFGAARGHDRATCFTLGTGVGSAWLDRGEPIIHRADVPVDGEAHLLSFDGRPLEETMSTRAIIGRYRQQTGQTADVRTIAERARGGDEAAREVLDAALTALGSTLAPWLQRFGATVAVVGGSISRSWDLLEAPLRAGIAAARPELAQPIELRASRLLDDAPLFGAAHWLRSR